MPKIKLLSPLNTFLKRSSSLSAPYFSNQKHHSPNCTDPKTGSHLQSPSSHHFQVIRSSQRAGLPPKSIPRPSPFPDSTITIQLQAIIFLSPFRPEPPLLLWAAVIVTYMVHLPTVLLHFNPVTIPRSFLLFFAVFVFFLSWANLFLLLSKAVLLYLGRTSDCDLYYPEWASDSFSVCLFQAHWAFPERSQHFPSEIFNKYWNQIETESVSHSVLSDSL